jgi:formate/nitrite transporter FocA (FNT family)
MSYKSIKTGINAIAIIAMAAGLFGMLFCFPFLWSAKLEDLVGAGFPFVSGAILFGTGLLTLAITNRQPPQ